MFIYEFMGGLVDTITGGESAEEEEVVFDPHQHRKIEKPTSYTETMSHLLKGSIGAGILAMPVAMSRVGVIAGVTGVFVVGMIATYCIHLLIVSQYELCKRHRRGYMSYAKSMRVGLEGGPKCLRCAARCSSCFVDGVMVSWQLGLCCVYVVFVASNIKQVMDYYNIVYTLRFHICFLLAPLSLINMIHDLKLLTPLSTISNIFTIMGLVLVFFYMVDEDIEMKEHTLYIESLEGVPVFVGMTLFALEAVGVVLALEYNMENPKKFLGACGLFNTGMAIIIALYALMGLFGFLKYGDDVRASITLNLPEAEKKAQVAKLVFAAAIFLTYPLQNFVAYSILWRRLRKCIKQSRHKLLDVILRISLIVVPWGCAVLIPRLGPFISFFGALCLSLLALVFPAVLDLCVQHPAGCCIILRDFTILILGILCLLSGVYTSIMDIVDAEYSQ